MITILHNLNFTESLLESLFVISFFIIIALTLQRIVLQHTLCLEEWEKIKKKETGTFANRKRNETLLYTLYLLAFILIGHQSFHTLALPEVDCSN